jgi:hypothetical protein
MIYRILRYQVADRLLTITVNRPDQLLNEAYKISPRVAQ